MKIRMHRGSLAESMKTEAEIAPTLGAVAGHVRAMMPDCSIGEVSVKLQGLDPRTGWNTHVVTVDGCAVAWTDGPVR